MTRRGRLLPTKPKRKSVGARAITIAVAYDGETGEYYVLDERRGLHLVSASNLRALRKKLLPIVRTDFADSDTKIKLFVRNDPGPRRPAARLGQ